MQAHRCGRQAKLVAQTQYVTLTPLFVKMMLPSSGPRVPSAPTYVSFLSLPWQWTHITYQVLNTLGAFTALPGNLSLNLVLVLCGISGYDPYFTHQETEALCRYLNCPAMKWESQDSNRDLSNSEASAPGCSHLLAKLNHPAWAHPAGDWTPLSSVFLEMERITAL